MTDRVGTTGRLLDLLALLQAGTCSGPELAARLGVTERSVRRDVQRLRDLGYPVDGEAGPGGGYRLVAGGALPPLVLDDDAAVAVAVCLRLASLNPVEGVGEGSLRALAVLDQVMPARLRRQVDAVQQATDTLPPGPGEPETVRAAVLLALARACRDAERVVLDYRARDGAASQRRAEPYRLVCTGRRWYLLAWDLDREDWRTFRVDRVQAAEPTGWRFTPREAPPAAEYVQRAITEAGYPVRVRVRVRVAPEQLTAFSPAAVQVRPEPGGAACELRFGVGRLADAVASVGHLVLRHGPVVDVLDPPELLDACRDLGRDLAGLGGPTSPPT